MGEEKHQISPIEERAIARYHILLMQYMRAFGHPTPGSLEDKILQLHLIIQARIDVLREDEQKNG